MMGQVSVSKSVPPQFLEYRRKLQELRNETCGNCKHFEPELVIGQRVAGPCHAGFSPFVRNVDRMPCGKFEGGKYDSKRN